MSDDDGRTPSKRLTFEDAVMIHLRIMDREFQSRIAADYDVNQARIAEIKFGKRFPGSLDVALGKAAPPPDLFSFL